MLVPAICVIFLFGLTAVHFVNLAHQQEEIGATQRKAIPAYESASTAANRLDQVVDMLNTAATTGDVDQIDAAKAVFGKLNDELDNVATLTPKQAKTSFSAKSAVADYFKIAEGISRKISTGKMDLSQATQVSQEMRSALKSAQDALEKLKENAHQDLTTTLDEINNDSRQFGIALALSVLLFGIVGTVMTLLTSRSVSRNAREITRCMSELANGKGDLTQRLPRTSQDEIGELVGQFNAFLGHLHNLIRELVSHIVSLEKVAGHLDSAVEKSEHLAGEEAKTLADTANAIRTITGSISTIADGAASASDLAHTAKTDAEACGIWKAMPWTARSRSCSNSIESGFYFTRKPVHVETFATWCWLSHLHCRSVLYADRWANRRPR